MATRVISPSQLGRTWHLLKRGVQVAASLALFNEKVGDLRWCEGASMLPTLNATGDLLLHRPLSGAALKTKLERGDVINFVSPLNPSVLACKRIIGLPGDQVLIDPTRSRSESIVVPAGHLWLQGDNYAVSVDSRTYGPVPLGLVRGKIVARVWPMFAWMSKPFEYKHTDDPFQIAS